MVEGVTLRLDFTGRAGQPVKAPPRIVECPHCGGKRYASTSAHAPRFSRAGLVDCVGRPLLRNGEDFVPEAS